MKTLRTLDDIAAAGSTAAANLEPLTAAEVEVAAKILAPLVDDPNWVRLDEPAAPNRKAA